jgi:hypothetical protein
VKFPENGPRDFNNKGSHIVTLNVRNDNFGIEIILFEIHGGEKKDWSREIYLGTIFVSKIEIELERIKLKIQLKIFVFESPGQRRI